MLNRAIIITVITVHTIIFSEKLPVSHQVDLHIYENTISQLQ